MKKTIILFLAALSSAIVSCSKDESDAGPMKTNNLQMAANINPQTQSALLRPNVITGVVPVGDYFIINKHSSLVLDMKDNNMANGALIQQWQSFRALNQIFHIKPIDALGHYEIDVPIAGHRSFDVKDNSTANGALVQTWTFGGTNNQKWFFTETQTKGVYMIKSVQTGKAMDIRDNSTQNGALLQMWDETGADNQLFMLERFTGN